MYSKPRPRDSLWSVPASSTRHCISFVHLQDVVQQEKKDGTKTVMNVISFGGEVTIPINAFPASSSSATAAGMVGKGMKINS